uniref:Choline transporter-like protein n=1 Tax=Alexandrium monilatum TaxID=311494 RepID=A0A7S4WH54_9DINO
MPPRTLQVMSQVNGVGSPLVGRARRRCTDALCCLVFLVAILAMLALGAAGVRYGDQTILVRFARGRDFKGRICGLDPEVKDFRLTYYTLQSGSLPVPPGNWTSAERSRLRAVCTSKCPQTIPGAAGQPVGLREADLCPPDMSPDWCTWYGTDTTQLADYCVDLDVFSVGLGNAGHWLQDLRASAPVLSAAPFVAILLGLLFLCFVDRCGACCIWVILGISAMVPAIAGAWIYLDAQGDGGASDAGQADVTGIHQVKPETRRNIAYSLWGFTALVLLLCCCFFGTVRGVIGVLRTTSQFLDHVPSQMIQPALVGLAQLVVFAIWLAIFVQVSSVNAQEGDQATCISLGDIYCLWWDGRAQVYGMAFLVVMLYWLINFLHALSHFGTSYAVGAWYFAPVNAATGRKEPAEGGHGPCDCRLSLKAFCHGLLRHPGSLAFGSLVITLAQVGRMLLWWAKKNEETLPQNPLVKCVRRAVDCLADCFTRFIEFVSEHAYVEMALTGEGFCHSAKRGASLAALRPALFLLVGRVACAVRLLGTAVITAGTTYTVVLLLLWFPVDGLTSTRVPVIAAAIAGFAISQVMMHPLSTAARACLHCLVLDEDHNRSLGLDAPAHTPQPLQLLVEQHTQEGDAESGGCCQRCRCCF